jgi:hypothetical protein
MRDAANNKRTGIAREPLADEKCSGCRPEQVWQGQHNAATSKEADMAKTHEQETNTVPLTVGNSEAAASLAIDINPTGRSSRTRRRNPPLSNAGEVVQLRPASKQPKGRSDCAPASR